MKILLIYQEQWNDPFWTVKTEVYLVDTKRDQAFTVGLLLMHGKWRHSDYPFDQDDGDVPDWVDQARKVGTLLYSTEKNKFDAPPIRFPTKVDALVYTGEVP